VTVHIADHTLTVTGDEGRLRQVLGNLLANARVHTPAGTAVSVSLAREDGSAAIRVADEGPGLAAADAARVFERFFRADASRARESGGTGLGLSIVASVVRAHAGTVTMDSAPGEGTRVTVRLPLATGAGAPVAAADG
jgi:two-component system OmpR family sensor kinase